MTKSPTAQPKQSSTPRHWKVLVETLKQSGLSWAEYLWNPTCCKLCCNYGIWLKNSEK